MERLKTNIVGPDGSLTSAICFVGEAPGEEEDQASPPRPFVGPAGRLHNRCLKTVGLLRSETLIRNVFSQRPPGNNLGYFFQDKKKTILTWEGQEHVDELEKWLGKLLKLREETGVGPNVLVALGAVPMMILTGKKRITKWRGSVLPCTLVSGFKVYCSFHPSYVNRLMNERPEALQGQKKVQAMNALPLYLKDLQRAEIQGGFPELRRPKRNFYIADTIQRVGVEFGKLRGEKNVSVDIETLQGADGPILWKIGFSPTPDYAFTIPFIRKLRFHWSLAEEMWVLSLISRFFLSKTKKIFQGGSFDLSILGRYHGLRLKDNTFEDTMLAHHASFPYLKKGLDTLCSIHTWEPYYKDEGKVWDGRRISDEAEEIYNCKDCAVTREIFPPILKDMKDLGTEEGYQRTLYVFPSILYMQIRGVRIDLEKKKKLTKGFEEKVLSSGTMINFLAKRILNINSPQQVSRLLYSDFDMPIQYDPKTRKPTTDKHALQKLLQKYIDPESKNHKFLKTLLDYRKFEKLRNTYAEMEVDSDGRIHTSYGWITTWRLNSSESHFGKGGNLQNIPIRSEEGRQVRMLFIPDLGMVFLSRDYIQAEAMFVAWDARDTRLMDLYSKGIDVHWERTKELFDMPQSLEYNPKKLWKVPGLEVSMPLYWFRELTKRFVHGGNYKMGPNKQHAILVSEGIYVSLSFCKSAMNSFRIKNPLTVQWQGRIEEKIRRDRILITPLGRKREFRGRLTDDLIRSAIAFKPQSTVGEMCQLGTANTYREEKRFEPLLNVHDEILGQCRDDPETIRECSKSLEKGMRIPLKIHGETLVIPSEAAIGKSWGEMEDYEG